MHLVRAARQHVEAPAFYLMWFGLPVGAALWAKTSQAEPVWGAAAQAVILMGSILAVVAFYSYGIRRRVRAGEDAGTAAWSFCPTALAGGAAILVGAMVLAVMAGRLLP